MRDSSSRRAKKQFCRETELFHFGWTVPILAVGVKKVRGQIFTWPFNDLPEMWQVVDMF